jgi:hypothetical protein
MINGQENNFSTKVQQLSKKKEKKQTREDEKNTEIETATGKKRFQLAAKNLFLTYPKCNGSKEDLLKMLLEHKYLTPHFIMIAQERHQDGNLHLHAYIQNKEKCTISSPKSLDFQGCHGDYKSAKGNYYEVKDYLEKDDEVPLVWGEPNMAKNKSEETKFGIAQRNKLLASKPLPLLVESGDVKIEQYCQIKKCVQTYQMDSIPVGGYMGSRRVLWICDQPGKGKSRWVRENFTSFYTKPQNKWWDGYRQEPVIVLDDFDKQGSCLAHYLKIWTDVYSFFGEVKGGTVPCNYHIMIITSNYWPNEIWSEENESQLIKAIERRMTIVNLNGAMDITEELKALLESVSTKN